MSELDDELQRLKDDGSIVEMNGETIKFNWPLLELLHPEMHADLWAAHSADVDEALQGLMDKGFIEACLQINDDGSLEMIYQTTALGKQVTEAMQQIESRE